MHRNFFIFNEQPLAGGSFSNWIFMLAENRFKIGLEYLPKALYIFLLTLATSPFRVYESKYDKLIEKREVEPVFIVGHFRSGTTYLHNILCQDKEMAYVTTFQTMAPKNIIVMKNFFKKLLSDSLPETRPMDDVKMAADYPYEEEYAIANLSPYSFYHGWYFPKNMKKYFKKYVLFDGIDKKILERWKKIYAYILKKAAFYMGKEKIILKNPPNTGRIKQLLEIFPNAKFIHIYRNPYHVYFSTVKLYEGIMPLFALQKYDMEKIKKDIFYFYEEMYKKFFREQNLINEENYIEIRYEDFIKEPLKTVEAIYKKLKYSNFEKAKKDFKDYIAMQSNYNQRKYKISEEMKNKIYSHWHFTIDKWGYE